MIESYAIGVNIVMDPQKVLGPMADVLKGFEKLLKAQNESQMALNEFAAGIRAATNATNSLAAAWRGVRDAANAAAAAAAAAGRAAAGAGGPAAGPGPSATGSGNVGQQASAMAFPMLLPGGAASGGRGGGGAIGRYGIPVFGFPVGGAGPFMLPGGGGGGGAGGGGTGGGGGGGALNAGGGNGFTMPGGPIPLGGVGGGGPSNFNLTSAYNAISIIDRLVQGIGKLIEKASGFNDALVRLQMQGMTEAQSPAAEGAIFAAAMATPGRNLEAVGTDLRSLRSVIGLGDATNGPDAMKAAIGALPHFEIVQAALAAATGQTRDAAGDMLTRGVEIAGGAIDPKTGKISVERFNKSLDAFYTALMAVAPVGKANDLLQLARQGSLIAKTMDPESFMRMMVAAVIDLGGSKAGTALQALGRQLYGGILSKHTAQEMSRLGLIPDGSYEATSGAGGGRLNHAALNKLDADIAAAGGLFGYFDTTVREAMKAHGITDPKEISKELFQIMNTDTARRLSSLFMGNEDQVKKEKSLYDKVPSAADALKLATDKDIGFNLMAMETSFSNLLQTIGKVNAPNIISVLNALTKVFDLWAKGEKINDDIDRHTRSLKWKDFNPFTKEFWYGTPEERKLFGLPPDNDSAPGGDANVHRQSYHMPASGRGAMGAASYSSDSLPTVRLRGDVILDGKKVGSVVAMGLASALGAPPTGAAAFDNKAKPAFAVAV